MFKESELTPMYRQWLQAKRDYPEVLLLFRMGDFYEMFGEDAETGSRLLGLTLTARKYAGDKKIPMCGVPYHALDRYLRQLVEQGYRAAICEQTEDPKAAKGLVKREVTRVVTPGTILEDELLAGSEHNFLVSVVTRSQVTGIAAVDASTGEFLVTELAHRPLAPREGPALPVFQPEEASPLAPVLEEVARLRPAEVLVADDEEALYEPLLAAQLAPVTLSRVAAPYFQSATEELCEHFAVASLRGFGCEHLPAAQAAAALALRYLKTTHLQALPKLSGLTTYFPTEFMVIDATTRRNLELVESQRGGKQSTLLALLDKTKTPMGARMLRAMVLQPLLNKLEIDHRLDAVQALVRDTLRADALTQSLKQVYDLERLLSRVTAGTANGRDLRAMGLSLQRLPEIKGALGSANVGTRLVASGRTDVVSGDGEENGADTTSRVPTLLVALCSQLDDLGDVADLLDRALAEEPPLTITEGGLIKAGYAPDLDELRDAAAHGREWIAELQDRERSRTGIKNLKVGFNQVFGYYIEITKSFLDLTPPDYTRKQTLANAERFITPELKEWESKVLGADERSQALEYELFVQLRGQVAAQADRILNTARALAQLDALLSLATAAVEYGYTRPEITEDDALTILGGRHPVVERTVGQTLLSARAGQAGVSAPPEAFVPNDAHLDCQRQQLLIITGPNMAGKSTYLRQVALIALLAQMGSFVPARQARIGLVDRIFTRVGASDDLATGQSTFMVEMTETANILHNATARSLVILDEIGRGTSTFDGLSIAWAVAEYLVRQVGAKTLFATHYHHLNELAEILPRVRNYRILVREEGDHITFLRQIAEGGTDRSYGIQVARLAGLPQEVIDRAQEVLRTIEQEDLAVSPSLGAAQQVAPTVQLTLFEAAPNPVMERLKGIDPDTLTPIEALLLLRELREGL